MFYIYLKYDIYLQVSLRSLSTDAASERKTSTDDPAFPSPQLPRWHR